jgi:NAD(P)H-nitrite reductase large subunit
VEALLTIASETVGVVNALRERVSELHDLTVTDRTGAENVAAVLGAYERALDRAGRLLVSVNRLGLDERRVRIEEARFRPIADAVIRAIASPEADLDFDQIERVRSAIATELATLDTI